MDASELVNRCKDGDRQALHLLYQRYRPRLLRICRQYAQDNETAEDLLHDAFVIILTSLGKLQSADKLESWMATIARNVGCHYCKHIDQEQSALQQIENENIATEETALMPDYDQLQALVAQLPKGYQQVFRLSVFEGLSHKEISRKLGIAPHSSSSQLSHAKRILQQLIKQWWVLLLLLVTVPTAWKLFRRTEPTSYSTTTVSEPDKPQPDIAVKPPHEELVSVSSDKQTPPHSVRYQTEAVIHTDTIPSSYNRKKKKERTDTLTRVARVKKEMPQPSVTFRPSSHSRSWNISLAYNGQIGLRDDYLGAATIGKESFASPSNNWIPSEQGFNNWINYNQYLNTTPLIPYDAETRSLMNIAAQNAAINGGVMEARYEHQLPVTLQFMLTRQLTRRLSFETGLSFTELSSTVTTGSAQAFIREHQRLNYLGVPFYWGWRWYDKGRLSLYSSAGAMLELPIRSTLDVKHMINGSNTFSKTSVPNVPVQWSATLSFGIQHSLTSGLSIYMEPSLQYFFPDGSNLKTYRTEHPVSITLPFGIRYTW